MLPFPERRDSASPMEEAYTDNNGPLNTPLFGKIMLTSSLLLIYYV